MVIIMLPMWMNFLLRTYAWMSILDNSGILNQFFQAVEMCIRDRPGGPSG